MSRVLQQSLIFVFCFIMVHLPNTLWAHLEDENQVSVRLIGVDRVGNDAQLLLSLSNNTGGAVTLRALHSAAVRRITIERQRTVFGVSVWQAVRFIRVEPGQAIALVPPDYRIIAKDMGPMMSGLNSINTDIEADFGPFGRVFVAGSSQF